MPETFFKIVFLETSSEESSDNEKEIRRPGERGKSAVKEIPDDDSDDANSPIEGYVQSDFYKKLF